jgi:class 3 adenylate cyclase
VDRPATHWGDGPFAADPGTRGHRRAFAFAHAQEITFVLGSDPRDDGVLAAFDGPARAVRAGMSLRDAGPSELGVQLRIGIHTGECEAIGDDLGGIGVHIAARVQAAAEPGEVLVSSTVKDLVVGSGLRFADRGEHTLKGCRSPGGCTPRQQTKAGAER